MNVVFHCKQKDTKIQLNVCCKREQRSGVDWKYHLELIDHIIDVAIAVALPVNVLFVQLKDKQQEKADRCIYSLILHSWTYAIVGAIMVCDISDAFFFVLFLVHVLFNLAQLIKDTLPKCFCALIKAKQA